MSVEETLWELFLDGRMPEIVFREMMEILRSEK